MSTSIDSDGTSLVYRLMNTRILRFLGVGGFCFLVTLAVNYALKFTLLSKNPTVAFLLANAVATLVSFVLTRQLTFRDRRGSRAKRAQFASFIVVAIIAIVINSAPLYLSRWVLGFHYPLVTMWTQELADFISGPLIGTLLATAFRWWALHAFVFTSPVPSGPDAA